jgi:hypothetical protein
VKIAAELILASKNAATGDVLTTLVLTFPRTILAEVLTHRAWSRNTSSTRAIPAKKMRAMVRQEPFIPNHIGQHQAGMTPGAELTGWKRKAAETIISLGRYPALAQNYLLEKLGVCKGVSGRLLEPWMWVRQVVTATDWQNFLLLRTHKDAEPHFRELARCIARELLHVNAVGIIDARLPSHLSYCDYVQTLQPGFWHIPFLSGDDHTLPLNQQLLLSAARCARTSYTVTSNKVSEWEADFKLAKRLIFDRHMSPFEHQAQAANDFRYYANLKSFIQYRKTIDGEDGGDRHADQLYNFDLTKPEGQLL